MKTLNLDSHFKPLGIDEIAFEKFTFAGGEPHIKISNVVKSNESVTITQRVRNFSDMGFLLLAVDALKRMKVKEVHLLLPYFPAARQDRLMVPGEALSVKVYADLINYLSLSSVKVFDPHSDVTPALLDNCIALPNYSFIKEVLKKIGDDVVFISPDGGALKKTYKVAEHIGNVEVVECSKRRDVTTGKLSGFHVYSDDLCGKDCLIIDDICDGGGTFLGLADELKAKNAGKLYLAVSHGLFTKGFELLGNCFEHIYSTNSFQDIQFHGLTQIKLNEELLLI